VRVDPAVGRTANASALRPPGNTPSSDQAQNVFLSPRVVDQQAFTELADELRSIIDDATSSASHLRTTTEEITAVREELREAAGRQRQAIEIATKLMRALDAKNREAAATQRALGVAEAQAAQREASFSGMVDDAVKRAVGDIEERLSRSIDERAAALNATLATIEETRSAIEQQLDTSVNDALTALRSATTQAAALAGWDPEDIVDGQGMGQPVRDSLADLVLRAERGRQQAQTATRELATLHQQTQDAVTSFGASVEGSAAFLDQLERRHSEIDEAVRRSLEEAAEVHEALVEQAAQIRDLSAPILAIRQKAQQTAERLGDMLQQGESLQKSTAESLQRLDCSVHDAAAVAETLEPWREVFFTAEADDTPTLPEPLQRVVDGFRCGLTQDLAKMASAMQLIASGAPTRFKPGADGAGEIVIKTAAPSEAGARTAS